MVSVSSTNNADNGSETRTSATGTSVFFSRFSWFLPCLLKNITFMLFLFGVCISAAQEQISGLRLIRTQFTGSRNLMSGSALIDIASINFIMDRCSGRDVNTVGGFVRASGSNVIVQASEFKAMTGPPVFELSCRQAKDGEVIDSSTTQTNLWLDTSASLTCIGVTFEDVSSSCRTVEDKCGGAIWAKGGANLLNLTRCVFRRCKTGTSGKSLHMGAAVLSGATNFVFEYCIVEECSSAGSVVHFKNGPNADPFDFDVIITGCSFHNIAITPMRQGEKTPENDVAGGSGFLVSNTKSLTLVDCHFSHTVLIDETSAGDGGCYRVVGGTEFSLTLRDCSFIDTRASRGGCFDIKGISIPEIIIENCVFQETKAEKRNGGVFFVEQCPTKFVVLNSIFKAIEAVNGSIIYRYVSSGGQDNTNLDIQSFEIINTTIDSCKVATASNVIIAATCTNFVFDNNTIIDIGDQGQIKFMGVSNTTIELHDCTFCNIQSEFFVMVLEFTGEPTQTRKLLLENCEILNVSSRNGFNTFNQGSFGEVVMDYCSIDAVRSTTNTWIDLSTSTSSESILTVQHCTFTNIEEGNLILFDVLTDTGKVEFRDLRFQDCLSEIGHFQCESILMDGTKIYNGYCAFNVSKCTKCVVHAPEFYDIVASDPTATLISITADSVEIQDATIERVGQQNNVRLLANSGYMIALETQAATLDNCKFSDVCMNVFSLSSGKFNLTACCFQGGCQAYITARDCELYLTEPVCFDKTEEEALKLTSVERTWEGMDAIFSCTDCSFFEPINPTSDSSIGGNDDSQGSGLPPGTIAAIAVSICVVVAVVVIVVLVLLLKRRKTESDNSKEPDAPDYGPDMEMTITTMSTITGSLQEEPEITPTSIFTSPDALGFHESFEEIAFDY